MSGGLIGRGRSFLEDRNHALHEERYTGVSSHPIKVTRIYIRLIPTETNKRKWKGNEKRLGQLQYIPRFSTHRTINE
jgi:hypothetical protein